MMYPNEDGLSDKCVVYFLTGWENKEYIVFFPHAGQGRRYDWY